jgi:hypothetical protein
MRIAGGKADEVCPEWCPPQGNLWTNMRFSLMDKDTLTDQNPEFVTW